MDCAATSDRFDPVKCPNAITETNNAQSFSGDVNFCIFWCNSLFRVSFSWIYVFWCVTAFLTGTSVEFQPLISTLCYCYCY